MTGRALSSRCIVWLSIATGVFVSILYFRSSYQNNKTEHFDRNGRPELYSETNSSERKQKILDKNRNSVYSQRSSIAITKQGTKGHHTASNASHYLQINRSSCVPLHYSRTDLPLVLLVSFPGSGNTWTRHLIQQATGILYYPRQYVKISMVFELCMRKGTCPPLMRKVAGSRPGRVILKTII